MGSPPMSARTLPGNLVEPIRACTMATILGSCSKFDSLFQSSVALGQTLWLPRRSLILARRQRYPAPASLLLQGSEGNVSFRRDTSDSAASPEDCNRPSIFSFARKTNAPRLLCNPSEVFHRRR